MSGNQLFAGSEIIAHRTVPDRMKQVADPLQYQKLLDGANGIVSRLVLRAVRPGALAIGTQLRHDYDFDGIELTLPTTLFDDRYVLDLDGMEVHLIHVGPCHQVGDTIVHVPEEGIVFAGDAVFRECTPMGWTGSCEKWLQCLDLIVWLDPEVIVPGHGPLCGIEGAMEMKAYLEYVRDESRRCFGQGLNALEAAKQHRARTVSRVAMPGASLRERRKRVSGIPQRAREGADGRDGHFQCDVRSGEGARNGGRVLMRTLGRSWQWTPCCSTRSETTP